MVWNPNSYLLWPERIDVRKNNPASAQREVGEDRPHGRHKQAAIEIKQFTMNGLVRHIWRCAEL